VTVDHLPVSVAELLKEPCRPLDICEQKGDDPSGQVPHLTFLKGIVKAQANRRTVSQAGRRTQRRLRPAELPLGESARSRDGDPRPSQGLHAVRNHPRVCDVVPGMRTERLELEPATGTPPLLIDFALLSVALMWASTFALFKIAWREIDPVAFTGIRFAAIVAFSILMLSISSTRVRPRRADVPALIASGLTGYFLYQMGFVLGLDRTSALASAILISTHPIFAVVVMWLARRQRPIGMEVVGVALGFLGVAVFLRTWDAFATARIGDLLSLGAAAAFGAYGVINQPLTSRYPSRELLSYGLVFGGLLVTVVSGAIAVLALDERLGATEVIGGVMVVAGLLVTRVSKKEPVKAEVEGSKPPAAT
jgi:drug/metabolite transporter (DMT)-like permease